MKLLIRSTIVVVAMLFLSGGASPKVLTEGHMHQLAIAGVRANAPGALRDPIGFERFSAEGYSVFQAISNVGEGSVGFYAIDPRTGDMWNPNSECDEITSPEIRRLQQRYRRELGLTASNYLKIRRRGPMCEKR